MTDAEHPSGPQQEKPGTLAALKQGECTRRKDWRQPHRVQHGVAAAPSSVGTNADARAGHAASHGAQ